MTDRRDAVTGSTSSVPKAMDEEYQQVIERLLRSRACDVADWPIRTSAGICVAIRDDGSLVSDALHVRFVTDSKGITIPFAALARLDPDYRIRQHINAIHRQMYPLQRVWLPLFPGLPTTIPNTGASIAAPKAGPAVEKKQCVFIGHGRSLLWERLNRYLKDDLHLKTVYYESESRAGESIVPILEDMLDKATFAVLVLTAEDSTADDRMRARQNVIHEAGLFQGRLGFDKAVMLVQEGIEGFSNVEGLQTPRFSGDNITEAYHLLRGALEKRGVIPSTPKAK